MAVLVLAVVSTAVYRPVMDRVAYSYSELKAIEKGDRTTSIGQRLVLWQAAFDIFKAHPWTGAGPGNFETAIARQTELESGKAMGFTHTHNMVLNAMVRTGIPGVLALAGLFLVPLVVGARKVRDADTAKRSYWAFLISLQSIYIVSGAMGLAIGHDILDSVFITGTMFAMYGLLSEDKEPGSPESASGPT
jgi:O-antigen ligase